jgi:ribonuclease HI
MKEVIDLSQGVFEIVFQWILSHCGIPSNDMVDTLAKDALNLPSPEELTTY